MMLPYTANPLLFWLDPSAKFVNQDANHNVLSIIERVSGRLISPIPAGAASLPVWTDKAVNGLPVLTFNASQILTFPLLPNNIASGSATTPITMIVGANLQGPTYGGAVCSLGANYSVLEFYNYGVTTPYLYRQDDAGNELNVDYTGVNPGFHVYTLVFNGTQGMMRVDGVQVATGTVTGSATPYTFTSTNIKVGGDLYGDRYQGEVGQILVYQGDLDLNAEAWMLALYGIT